MYVNNDSDNSNDRPTMVMATATVMATVMILLPPMVTMSMKTIAEI
jgi:hypothetical protein